MPREVKMTEEQIKAMTAAIEKIPFCKVDISVLQNLQPVPFKDENSKRSEIEVYTIRSVDDWMIVVEYRPSDHACVASLVKTTNLK